MVPTLSILFMFVAGLVSFGLPVGLFLFWRKKYDLKLIPVLVGAAGFILFAMILEQLLHSVVLRSDAGGEIPLMRDNPALFVLYGLFAAGIFEETARFLSFKLIKKKYHGLGTALSYGIGHGGIEAVILLGFTSINNIVLSIMVNTGTPQMLESVGITPDIVGILTGSNPSIFLVGALERIFAVTLHVSLSVLVWIAATKSGKVWLYPAAILLHALFNLPAALMQAGIISSLGLTETIVGALAVAIALSAVWIYRRYGTEAEPQQTVE